MRGKTRSRVAAKGKIQRARWSQVRLAPIVLLSGPEDLLADRARQLLRAAAQQQASDQQQEVEFSDLDAREYASGSLLSVASPSLFAQPRFIWVDHLEQMTDAFLSDAIDYIGQADPDVTVVLRHRKGVRGKKLLTAIRDVASALEVECAELKRDDDKQTFVREELQLAGRRIDPDAARALVDAFSADTTELAAACRQLVADVTENITRADIDRYFGGRVETTGFAIADAALAGQTAKALVLVRHAGQQGMNAVPIVAAIATKVRLMAAVCEVHASPQQLASRVGGAPWQIRRAQQDAARWNPVELGRAVRAVADTDAQIKGQSVDGGYALERLVRRLATRRIGS
ncbi:DNA polymerase III subunit delta [Pseudoclavibacter sp. CFCC 11306]|nr:DNA polymerase III subunit delta [Pseudoclavibacter sp. CFCC 11306]